jgi:hypothetical protein
LDFEKLSRISWLDFASILANFLLCVRSELIERWLRTDDNSSSQSFNNNNSNEATKTVWALTMLARLCSDGGEKLFGVGKASEAFVMGKCWEARGGNSG